MISHKPTNTSGDVPTGTLAGINKVRLVVISNAQPRFVWRLAERLRNEVSGATVCGVVYVRYETKRKSLRRLVQTAIKRVSETFLDWMHACPGTPNRSPNFTEDDLAQYGSAAGWQLLSASRLSSSLDFISSRAVDLCVVLGDLAVNESIAQSCRLGAIVVPVAQHYSENLLDRENSIQEISLSVQRIANGSTTEAAALSTKIPVEPYDTTISLLLKANLIATDLAIEAAARIASGNWTSSENLGVVEASDPLPYLSYWRRRKYPGMNERSSPRYARPLWKLCLAQGLLFSYMFVRNWWRRLRRQFPVTILVHHLISDVPHRLGMPTDALYREIEFLKRHYRIVSLSAAVHLLKSGVVDEPTVVLTFDDGYQENFITLRAVLEATGVPISMFVCTGIVSTQNHFLHDDQPCVQSDFVSLSWDQVSYLHGAGVEIGSHTRSHFDCGSSVSATLVEEIVGSKNDLEKHLNAPIRFFAFPFGKRDNISPQAINIATSCYEHFLSSCSGDNFPSPVFKERQLMRKSLPHNCWELELTLQSVLDFREEIKQAFNRRLKQPHCIDVITANHADQKSSAV